MTFPFIWLQIDLRLEADNFATFTDLFSDDSNIRFPRPIQPYIWSEMIVQSLEVCSLSFK